MASGYRIYRINGRPIFAVPDGRSGVRLAGLARYQPFTFRRSLYRHVMNLAIRTNVDQLISTRAASPLSSSTSFVFEDWLREIRSEIDQPEASAVVFWPPQSQRQRLYVHLLDSQLNQIGFAKISMDAANDVLLDREASTLNQLAQVRTRFCRVPVVLSHATFAGHRYLLMEPLPANALPLPRHAPYPANCVEEYAGTSRDLPAQSFSTLSWWSTFVGQLHSADEPILTELEQLTGDRELRVRRGHGDFGPANMVRSADCLWIFDWEASSPDAPAHVDALSYELAMRFIKHGARTVEERVRVEVGYLRQVEDERRPSVLLSLAYLRTVRRDGFRWLISEGQV